MSETQNTDVDDLLENFEDAEAEEGSDQVDTEKAEDPQEFDRVRGVAAVVPLHAVTGGIKRGRGRPRKVEPKPIASDLAYHAEMSERKARFIDTDAMVAASKDRRESIEFLQQVKKEIALESAALHFQRIEHEKFGKDVTQISRNRIAALREVASIELEIKKLGVDAIDLKSEKFQKIFRLLLEKLNEAASEVLTRQQCDLLFNRLETSLSGWEEEALDRIR